MPTELEELVGFLSHGNTQIRQVAVENVLQFSTTQPALFKIDQLQPIKNLKLLVRDYKPIAKNVLTILINLSTDTEILDCMVKDDEFLKILVTCLTNPQEANATLFTMLLANLAKSKEITRLLTLEVAIPKTLPTGGLAITQLFDLFVRGAASKSVTPYNVNTDFDYLSYLFADLAQHASGREYFLTKQSTDDVIPITKVTVFTDHTSDIRRRGVASTLKNVAFEISSHPFLMSEDEANVLPYILLPLMGSEEYSDEDTDGMLMDLQLLAPDKQRDCDLGILKTHIETLMILTTTRPGRIQLRDIKVYPIIRELHVAVEDDEVREACDRLVQVLMADEEDEAAKDEQTKSDARMIAQADPVKEVDSDDDDKIVEV